MSKPIIYQGVTYPSISALARDNNVSRQYLHAELKKGRSIIDILNPKSSYKNRTPIEFQDKIYLSLAALAREHHVNYPKLYLYLKKGMDIKQAISYCSVSHEKKTPVKYKGKAYPSIAALAREHNVNYCTLFKALKKGMNSEQAISHCRVSREKKTSVKYKGKTYPSIAAFAREYNVNYQALQTALKKGMKPEQAISRYGKNKPVEYQDKTYPSITADQQQICSNNEGTDNSKNDEEEGDGFVQTM